MRVTAAKVALAALGAAFVVTHVLAVFTETINWDELVLLQRAERTIATGQLFGSGRPGLGTLVLLPFVDGCTSSVDTVHAARLAWCAITFALFGGLFTLLFRTTKSWQAAALGTALLALVPVVMRWSVHVRTDQPALACALWGGVAVLASARRPAWGVLAGALFAGGYLFSQKAVYVVGLAGVVALGDLFIAGRVELRRVALRIAAIAAGGIAVLAIYRFVVPQFYATPPTVTLGKGLSQFEFYRSALGYRVYWAMLPTLIPLLGALVLVVVATVVALRRNLDLRKPLLVAALVATLGIVVGRFHAAAFPYFWMTLGMFFAAAVGLAWPSLAALWPRVHMIATALLWTALVWFAARALTVSLLDAQAVQRDMLGFVERDFTPAQRSFHPHGALFCRADPDPMGAMLVESTMHRFARPEAAAEFIAEFRTRPIAILVLPNQIAHFPPAVHAFWDANYQPYYGSVRVAGRKLAGAAGSRHDIEIVVRGTYRWYTRDGAAMRITVDGTPLARGDVLDLAPGAHAVELVDAGEGILVLAVPTPPKLDDTPFYSERWVQEWHANRAKTKPQPVYR